MIFICGTEAEPAGTAQAARQEESNDRCALVKKLRRGINYGYFIG